VHLLNPLIVGKGHPHGFLVGFEDSGFYLDAVRLDVFVSFNTDSPNNGFSFLEGWLVEGYPDFTLWRY
jgi:hypothetical protein